MHKERIKALVNVALGRDTADLVIKNANLVNTYSGELLEGYSIAIKGEKIAFVGKNGNHTIGSETKVIDAEGKVVIPGFIDAHTHLDIPIVHPNEYLRYSILSGTTTVVTETLEIANVLGYEGVLNLLDALKEQPIKFFATVPSLVPTLPALEEGTPISPEEVDSLLKLDRIVGLGETHWLPIIDENEEVLAILSRGHEVKKRLEGHGAGAKGNKLVAFAAAGISSCHESITMEEAVDRLRLGMYVMVREGSVRRDLEAISSIRGKISDFRRLILVSDGLNPEDLLNYGHMSYIVQKAIDLGFEPIKAIQMATINPAEYFSLDGICGGIAPGRDADILIIPDLRTIRCQLVIAKGQIAAQNGELLLEPRKDRPPAVALKSVRLPKRFTAADFNVPVRNTKVEVEVRVVNLVSEVITRELIAKLPVANGSIQADPKQDIVKVAVIDRHHGTGRSFTGFVKGFGMKSGAFASSYSWEARSPIVVIGANEDDMACAVNRIAELSGGIIVCAGGKILAELPLPIGGLLATCSVEEAAERLYQIRQSLKNLGCSLSNPYLSIQTLSGTFLPYFRITQEGLVNSKEKRIVALITGGG